MQQIQNKLEKEQFYTFHSKVWFFDELQAAFWFSCELSISRHGALHPPCSSCVQEFIEFISNSEEEYSDYVYQELPEEHNGLKFGIDNDCPVFPGLWDFCRLYAGASVGVALPHSWC